IAYGKFGDKDDPQLVSLREVVLGMKSSARGMSITSDALLEVDRMLELLPTLVRKRGHDSLLFGVLAFVVASIIARPPIGIIVGVIVWLYFRFETNKTYDNQVSKLEQQKRAFARKKDEFLKDL